jgi:thiamine biosynthesis lipoprotein
VHEIIDIHDRAMATSGNYRNFYIDENGRKLSHTIDPKTGYPVRHGLLSSTVLAPSCAMADAYATSFMVMGLDKAKEIVTRNNNLQAYFIYTENDSTGKFQTWNNLELTQ